VIQELRERAALGAKYREYLPDFLEAIDAVEQQYAAKWADTFTSEERDNLWRAVRVCRKMKEHFGSLVGSGELASHQITELQRLK
jgi:hypothetical protein